jgi:3-oxoadipate enol-lactonase
MPRDLGALIPLLREVNVSFRPTDQNHDMNDTTAKSAPPATARDHLRGVGIVFLHGMAGGARAWTPQLATFAAAGLQPVALDLPGYGARTPISRMSFDELAADVEAAIAERALDRPVLVGHSLGGMVVQTALRRRPDAYRAAVLVCTSPAFGDRGGEFQKKFVADRLGPLDAGGTMATLAGDIVAAIVGPAPNPAGVTLAHAVMATTPDSTYRAAVHCLVTFDERANLANTRVPVLCLAGAHDRNAPPAMMERMAAKIPGARYVCLPDVGHLPNLEAPHAFDAAVLDFLGGALTPTARAEA